MASMLRDKDAVATKISKKLLGVPASQQYCDDKKRVSELEKAANNSRRTNAIFKDLESGSYNGEA
jgi:hypothetical protein